MIIYGKNIWYNSKKREVTIMEIYLDNVATTKMDNEVALNLNRLT